MIRSLSLILTVGSTLPAFAAEPLKVAVANHPLAYFTQRIAGSLAVPHLAAPADEDPAFWQPSDADVATMQQADLILMNGATYSKWADKVTLPRAKTIDTAAAFKDQFITIKGAAKHSHGKGDEHSHDGTAFTTWIDFTQAAQQATAIHAALVKKLPDAHAPLDAGLAALKADLATLDQRLLAAGKVLAQRPLMASHPVYHYFARRYGLNLKDVLWEPESVPTPEQMEGLKAVLKDHPATVMIWEGEPAAECVTKVKSIGLSSTVFAPCGNVPDTGDWLSVMQANVANIESLAAAK
jgi:zinc transport system substrate-binding protein